MPRTSPTISPCTIAVLSRHYLIWLGFESIFEGAQTPRIVLRPYRRTMAGVLRAARQPDVVIVDLETQHDVIGTIQQIRESAPNSKVVLLNRGEDRNRKEKADAYGADGIILTDDPPLVVVAVIQTLHLVAKNRTQRACREAVGMSRPSLTRTTGRTRIPFPTWLDA